MFKIKYLPFKFIPSFLALVLLVPNTLFATGPDGAEPPPASTSNSVTILIDGQQVDGPIGKGDVIHRGERINGECDNPSITVRARGDVRKVKVGPDGDTCDLKVKVLDLNTTELSDPDAAFVTGPGYKWQVDILSLVEGIPPEFDNLTKTRSKFTFKTPSFTNSGSLFDGGGGYGSCWGHYDPPLYYYTNASCRLTRNLTSPTKMYHKVVGDYDHEKFDSWGHTVTANAVAHGNTKLPKSFDYECSVVSKPPGSNLECEFDWEYLGYQ